MTETENSLLGLTRRFEQMEEFISVFKDRTIEMIDSK